MTKKKLLIGLMSFFALTACGGSDDGGGSTTPSNPGTGTSAITLSPAVLNVSASEGTYTVNVASPEVDWSATTSTEWLNVTAQGTVATKGLLSIKVQANTGTAERTGTITVKSRNARATLTVVQSDPMQVSTHATISVSGGSTATVTVSAKGDWTATASDAWLIPVKSDPSTLTITTQPNTTASMRSGVVTITLGGERQTIDVLQDAPEVTAITTPDGYKLVWNDEFNQGTELNSDWRHEVQGPGWVNHELQTYVNGSAAGRRVTELVDGKLRITCFKSANTVYSGRVYAKPSEGWTYGYIEARIKLPKGKGTWPAFWMMPVHFTSWPADGEIDIMEEVGYHPNYVSSSLHATDHVHSNGTQVTHEMFCAGAEADYHVYAIEWTHDNITTYVDGKQQLSYNNTGKGRSDWPYDDPFYVILNLAWGGDWGAAGGGVDESALPATMFVDYVRVFQKAQ